jgi:hypothetical protein
MGRAAAASSANERQRDPFRVDEDCALEALRLAWGDAYDIGFEGGSGTAALRQARPGAAFAQLSGGGRESNPPARAHQLSASPS